MWKKRERHWKSITNRNRLRGTPGSDDKKATLSTNTWMTKLNWRNAVCLLTECSLITVPWKTCTLCFIVTAWAWALIDCETCWCPEWWWRVGLTAKLSSRVSLVPLYLSVARVTRWAAQHVAVLVWAWRVLLCCCGMRSSLRKGLLVT